MPSLPVASHTMLEAFDNCPHKGFRMYIAKDLPRKAETDAMRWGKDVHKSMSMLITRGRVLPEAMRQFEPLAMPFVGKDCFTELPLAIDRAGKPCGFYDDTVFLRGYGDVVVLNQPQAPTVAALFDWKTGKKREDPAELRRHALMLHASYPTLQKMIGYYIWLQDCVVGKPHDVSDTHVTWAKLNEQMDEIRFMLEQNSFPKQPNPLCGWCDVKDCEHNRS